MEAQKAQVDALRWDKTRVSHQLRRMEARGLLTRQVTAEGRGIDVTISARGRLAIAQARPVHARAIRAHILRFVGPENGDALIELATHLKEAG